jgi:peroxiredoxin
VPVGDIVTWVLVGLVVLTQIALGLLVYQLLRQHGRLLLRVEALEGRPAGQGAAQPHPQPRHHQPQRPQGLTVGATVEPFSLPAVSGETVALADYRGRRVLLVHWNPGCGFCAQIAAELAELEPKLRSRNTELVLVSYGDAESNRAFAEEHGLTGPILLQESGTSLPAFHTLGTPVAYLLDEQGRVAEPLAFGALEVPELARSAADGRKRLASERSLDESRIQRDGLEPGTKAPNFELDDVRGGKVSLDAYRGRPLLLVLSDPDCGPCNALLPDLARLQDETTIVMVSSGDVAANRAKVEEHALDFPVAVQPGRQVSKQYGIFATPVAFFIDEEGVVAREVARGKDEIVALAPEAPTRRGVPLAH